MEGGKEGAGADLRTRKRRASEGGGGTKTRTDSETSQEGFGSQRTNTPTADAYACICALDGGLPYDDDDDEDTRSTTACTFPLVPDSFRTFPSRGMKLSFSAFFRCVHFVVIVVVAISSLVYQARPLQSTAAAEATAAATAADRYLPNKPCCRFATSLCRAVEDGRGNTISLSAKYSANRLSEFSTFLTTHIPI